MSTSGHSLDGVAVAAECPKPRQASDPVAGPRKRDRRGKKTDTTVAFSPLNHLVSFPSSPNMSTSGDSLAVAAECPKPKQACDLMAGPKRHRKKTKAQRNRAKARKQATGANPSRGRNRSARERWQKKVSDMAMITVKSPVWANTGKLRSQADVREWMENHAQSYLTLYRLSPPDIAWAIPTPADWAVDTPADFAIHPPDWAVDNSTPAPYNTSPMHQNTGSTCHTGSTRHTHHSTSPIHPNTGHTGPTRHNTTRPNTGPTGHTHHSPTFGPALPPPKTLYPRYLVIHIPDAYTEQTQRKVMDAWDYAKSLNPKQTIHPKAARHAHADPDEHSNDTIYSKVLHLLQWRRSSANIFPTAETVQAGDVDRQYTLLKLCGIIGKYMGLPAREWLKVLDDPAQDMVTGYHQLSEHTHPQLQEALDRLQLEDPSLKPFLLRVANSLAVTERVGENYHLDFGDAEGTYTLLAPVGDWTEGGELEIPTLGLRHRLPSGSATFFLPKVFPHRVTPYAGGRRLSLTLATCQIPLLELYKDSSL